MASLGRFSNITNHGEVKISHIWNTQVTHMIKIKVRDVYGEESF